MIFHPVRVSCHVGVREIADLGGDPDENLTT